MCLGKLGVRGCWSVLPRLGGLRFLFIRVRRGREGRWLSRLRVLMGKMAVDGKKGRAGGAGGMMSPRGPVPGLVHTDGRTSFNGYPGGPSSPPHQNQQPSGTGSGPGFVNQGPPSYSSTGYPAGTGYNSGVYASVAAAAAPEYPGQNSYGPPMNRLPPIQGGYPDSGNYGPSPVFPTQPNMPPAGPRGPHGGMYQGGPPYY